MEIPRPKKLLTELSRDYPQIWKIIDDMVSERGKNLPKWADWCFLPMAAACAIASGGKNGPIDGSTIKDISRIAALVAWRVGQGIYRFHDEALKSISETPLTGNLPSELLYRLPEWCVYIEFDPPTKLSETPVHGFFAHLEQDHNTGHHELRLLLDSDRGLLPIVVHLEKPTLREAVLETFNEIEERKLAEKHDYEADLDTKKLLVKVTEPYVSLLLYLCSNGSDTVSEGGKTAGPTKPAPKKTKKGMRYFPPDKPTIWKVAYGIGKALAKAREKTSQEPLGGTHASPSPHIRKAHWHSFWKGPKDSPAKRYLVVYWLPPIPVGIRELDAMAEN